MSGSQEVTYTVAFRAGKRPDQQPLESEGTGNSIPRIARLMALAIRFEGLVRAEKIRDYAELARRGRVTRARVTHPDIQEQILFLPPIHGLNERNLRRIVSLIHWREQRPLFQKIIAPGVRSTLARFEFGSLRQETPKRFVLDYRVKSHV